MWLSWPAESLVPYEGKLHFMELVISPPQHWLYTKLKLSLYNFSKALTLRIKVSNKIWQYLDILEQLYECLMALLISLCALILATALLLLMHFLLYNGVTGCTMRITTKEWMSWVGYGTWVLIVCFKIPPNDFPEGTETYWKTSTIISTT